MTRPTVARTLLNLLDWLADRDADWRQRRILSDLPDERLTDMGLDRRTADAAFFRRFSDRRADSASTLILGAARLR